MPRQGQVRKMAKVGGLERLGQANLAAAARKPGFHHGHGSKGPIASHRLPRRTLTWVGRRTEGRPHEPCQEKADSARWRSRGAAQGGKSAQIANVRQRPGRPPWRYRESPGQSPLPLPSATYGHPRCIPFSRAFRFAPQTYGKVSSWTCWSLGWRLLVATP
jgi:hypothetical protein